MLMLFRVVVKDGAECWINANDIVVVCDDNEFGGAAIVLRGRDDELKIRGVKASDVMDALHRTVNAASEQLQTKLNDAVDQLVDAKSGKVFQ